MWPNEINLLIDHLDKTLEGKGLQEVETRLQTDTELAEEFFVLKFTAANIYDAGLYAEVARAKEKFATDQAIQRQSTGGVVRTMNKTLMRVAAVLVFVTFSAGLYKYFSVSEAGIYEKYYDSYDLRTSRSAPSDDELENAYVNRNWNGVISISKGIASQNNKHLFLAGVAHLELKQHSEAIRSFQGIISNNTASQDHYFGDEAEYYLAMSYLAANQGEKAIPILDQIRKDEAHTYNQIVEGMGIDYKILKMKR